MKRIFFIFFILMFLLLGLSSGSFGGWKCDDSKCDKLSDFKTSKNVTIKVESSDQLYAAISGHKSGNKEFGVYSGSSRIYWKSKDKGKEPDDPGTSDSSAFNNWNSL